MKRFFLSALAAGVLVAPTGLTAQQPFFYEGVPASGDVEYLQFLGGSGVNGGYGVQVGPYLARFNESPATAAFSIYCVDYLHSAKSGNVVVTALADAGTPVTRLNDYRQVAYLSSLFDTVDEAEWGKLHAAIWSLTSAVTPGGNTGVYRTAAYDAPVSFSTAGWYVLSPTSLGSGSGQEFLMRTPVSVPEPSTVLLLGTGLLLFMVARRRRPDFLGERA